MNKQDLKQLIREEIKKTLKEVKVPKSGESVNDEDLRKKYFKSIDDYIEWLKLWRGNPYPASRSAVPKHVELANWFLNNYRYPWRIKNLIGRTRLGDYIWDIE